jgi:hypothetical protein
MITAVSIDDLLAAHLAVEHSSAMQLELDHLRLSQVVRDHQQLLDKITDCSQDEVVLQLATHLALSCARLGMLGLPLDSELGIHAIERWITQQEYTLLGAAHQRSRLKRLLAASPAFPGLPSDELLKSLSETLAHLLVSPSKQRTLAEVLHIPLEDLPRCVIVPPAASDGPKHSFHVAICQLLAEAGFLLTTVAQVADTGDPLNLPPFERVEEEIAKADILVMVGPKADIGAGCLLSTAHRYDVHSLVIVTDWETRALFTQHVDCACLVLDPLLVDIDLAAYLSRNIAHLEQKHLQRSIRARRSADCIKELLARLDSLPNDFLCREYGLDARERFGDLVDCPELLCGVSFAEVMDLEAAASAASPELTISEVRALLDAERQLSAPASLTAAAAAVGRERLRHHQGDRGVAERSEFWLELLLELSHKTSSGQ